MAPLAESATTSSSAALMAPSGRAENRTEIDLAALMTPEVAVSLDWLDAPQQGAVIKVCRVSRTLSDAGRQLYAVSRDAKAKPNDADRLKKYLTRFG